MANEQHDKVVVYNLYPRKHEMAYDWGELILLILHQPISTQEHSFMTENLSNFSKCLLLYLATPIALGVDAHEVRDQCIFCQISLWPTQMLPLSDLNTFTLPSNFVSIILWNDSKVKAIYLQDFIKQAHVHPIQSSLKDTLAILWYGSNRSIPPKIGLHQRKRSSFFFFFSYVGLLVK